MKNLLFLLLTLLSMSSTKLYSQCNYYGYILSTNGFNCQYSTGEICVKTIADWTSPYADCAEYVVEIEYPIGDFIFTDLGDFYVFYQDAQIVKLRADISLVYDLQTQVCLQGLFTLKLDML